MWEVNGEGLNGLGRSCVRVHMGSHGLLGGGGGGGGGRREGGGCKINNRI